MLISWILFLSFIYLPYVLHLQKIGSELVVLMAGPLKEWLPYFACGLKS